MSGATGLIFAMRSRYKTQGGTEALFDEAESKFSGNVANANIPGSLGTSTNSPAQNNPAVLNDSLSWNLYFWRRYVNDFCRGTR